MHPDTEDRTTSNWMKEAQKGYIRVGILILLSKKSSHGYEIMKEIKARTKGFWKPTAGGVYPVLGSLEKAGYIKGEWVAHNNRKIKTYKITERGRNILNHAIMKQNEIASNINSLFEEYAKDVLNMNPEKFPMPVMPTPFSAFLEEGTEETVERLQQQKNHAIHQIKMHQDELKLINRKISEKRKV